MTDLETARRTLARALTERLSGPERHAFLLRNLERLTLAEVSMVLRVRRAAVRRLLADARRKLIGALTEGRRTSRDQ